MCLRGSASCISREDTLQTQRRFWKGFQQYNVVNFVVSSCIVVALVLYFANVTPSAKAKGAHAQRVVQSQCADSVLVESGQAKKLSTLVAQRQHNAAKPDVAVKRGKQRIQQSDANLNLLSTNQRCIPGNKPQSNRSTDTAHKMLIAAKAPVVQAVPGVPKPPVGQTMPANHVVPQKWSKPSELLSSASQNVLDLTGSSMRVTAQMLQGSASNVFPPGQCTWWANQRYHQLYGPFVPWRTNADAFQWVARAIDFGWHVSGLPHRGSIMVLQPYVEGAYGLGHVAVVEQVLTDGRVIASSINWGANPNMVTQATFNPGPGVSFISAT
jgi:surface antigen